MLAFDIDNTIADTCQGVRDLLALHLGMSERDIVDTPSYRYPALPPGMDVHAPSSQVKAFYAGIWHHPRLLSDMPAIRGAPELLREIARAGMLSGYVTRRPPQQYNATQRWLARHQFPHGTLLHALHPEGSPAACKSLSMLLLGARVLIDDHAEEVRTVMDSGLGGAVLLTRPYNTHAALPAPSEGRLIARVSTLAEAVHTATGMAAMLAGMLASAPHTPSGAGSTWSADVRGLGRDQAQT